MVLVLIEAWVFPYKSNYIKYNKKEVIWGSSEKTKIFWKLQLTGKRRPTRKLSWKQTGAWLYRLLWFFILRQKLDDFSQVHIVTYCIFNTCFANASNRTLYLQHKALIPCAKTRRENVHSSSSQLIHFTIAIDHSLSSMFSCHYFSERCTLICNEDWRSSD